jgi:dihydroorotate dehydrogenase (fumarate)
VWTALLSRRVGCSLAAGRGVESEAEVIKLLLVGADVVMTASALLRHGPQHVTAMKEGLVRWLAENRFDSVEAIRGLKDASHVTDANAFLRSQYITLLSDYLPGKLV